MDTTAATSHVIVGLVSEADAAQTSEPSMMTSKPWRVLLVDDDATARTLLRILLEEYPEIQVVGEAADGEEAVALAEHYRPDVILMDIHLTLVSGVEATRRINRKLPHIMIIGISMQYTPHSYNAMIAAGAVAFVSKEEVVGALYKTIKFSMHSYYPNRYSSTAPDGKTS